MATAVTGLHNARLIQSATQKQPLGTRMELPDGRVFRYAKAGAVALTPGKLMATAVVTTGHDRNLAVAADAAIGATSITITNASTAITKDQYAEGYLFPTAAAAGFGQICTIRSHPAETTTSGSCVIRLEDEDALAVAFTSAATKVGLRKNIYKDVIINPTTITGCPLGVTPIVVDIGQYFWLQTWGPAAVLTNGTLVIGKNTQPGESTDGSVDVMSTNATAADGLEPGVGPVINKASTGEYSLIYLMLAP